MGNVASRSAGWILALTLLAALFVSALLWNARPRQEDAAPASVAEIEQILVSMALSDEAVRRLDNQFDAAWVEAHLAPPQGAAAQLFVLDQDNRPIYGVRDRTRVAAADFAKVRGAQAVIAKVRRTEAAGANGPVQASQVVVEGGKSRLISAALVQPQARARLKQPYAPVLVLYTPLDAPRTPAVLAGMSAILLALSLGAAGIASAQWLAAPARRGRNREPLPARPGGEGEMTKGEEPFHLADLLRASAAVVAAIAEDKSVDLIIDIDPQAETVVTGASAWLKETVVGLLFDAVKFTDDGYVALVARPEPAGRWRIEVQDTGMDPAYAERAGAAKARRLVGLMSGEFATESVSQRGATFTLRLPLPPHKPDTRAGHRRLSVLLADHQPASRQALQVLLADMDADLTWVESGREVMQAVATRRFDLALVELQSSARDGIAALRSIREHEQAKGGHRTMIVTLSAGASPEDEAAASAAGADLHMFKPIEAGRLAAILRSISERQVLADAA